MGSIDMTFGPLMINVIYPLMPTEKLF